MDEQQLQELQREVRQLRERVAYLEEQTGFALAAAPERQEGEAPALARNFFLPAAPDASAAAPPLPRADAGRPEAAGVLGLSEGELGGRWFNRLGILAIMLAVSFFLKWSFDNNLIGELGRVVIGLVIGLGFLGAGERLQQRQYRIYGQGFTGGGIGILYFSIFAAFQYYHLLPQLPAFALMVLVTLAASLLAVRYDSLAVGLIGLVGGFATPFLLHRGPASRVALFTYVAVLDAGVLLVAYYRKWPLFYYLTFCFTYFSFLAGLAGSEGPSYRRHFDGVSFSYLTLFFLLYLGVPLVRPLRLRQEVHRAEIMLVLLNAAVYFLISTALLDPHGHGWIGFWAVLLGAVYLGLGWGIYRRFGGSGKLSLTFFAVATVCLVVAVPLQLDGYWVPMAWAAEAVLLFYLGSKLQPETVPLAGFLVLACALVSLLSRPFVITGHEPWIFLSKGAVAYLVVISAMALISWLYRRQPRRAQVLRRRDLLVGLQLAWNLLLILFFTLQVEAYYDYLYRLAQYQGFAALENAKNLTLSLVWGLHAAALVLLGFWRRLEGSRRFGLGFLGVVILKVFLYDLSNLSTPNRILSFLALGVILLAISWLYHRYKTRLGGGSDDEDAQ